MILMKSIKLFALLLLLPSAKGYAQDSTAHLSVSGYAEAYYTFDFNKPSDHQRPGFFYSHNRHNEFNLNLGYLKAAYTASRVRANLALGTGTYMQANYAAEPDVLKNIYEANAGVKLSAKKDLWLDAGIFASHIGFESAVSKDCWTLTRSILADNSPYYEAGLKLGYTSTNGKWYISGMALNGWQRIRRVNGNSMMSWGAQLQYKPSSAITINYSNFYGTDSPDSTRKKRLFHNFYGIFSIGKWGVTTGIDIGTEQKAKGSTNHNTWYAPVLILRYAPNERWAVAARAEYYADANGVIISSGTPNGFKTTGFSFNIDHSPFKQVLLRMEYRYLRSKDPVFTKNGAAIHNNSFISSSLAVNF